MRSTALGYGAGELHLAPFILIRTHLLTRENGLFTAEEDVFIIFGLLYAHFDEARGSNAHKIISHRYSLSRADALKIREIIGEEELGVIYKSQLAVATVMAGVFIARSFYGNASAIADSIYDIILIA